MSKNNYVDGLYVKDGRLINDRPAEESGIARAAAIKRAVTNDRKINRIAFNEINNLSYRGAIVIIT